MNSRLKLWSVMKWVLLLGTAGLLLTGCFFERGHDHDHHDHDDGPPHDHDGDHH